MRRRDASLLRFPVDSRRFFSLVIAMHLPFVRRICATSFSFAAVTLLILSSAPLIAQVAAPEAPAEQKPKLKGPERWEKEIAGFETADAANPPKKGGIVFTGSSSIRMWKTLEQDFPNYPVLNRGFGGSQISDAVHFADRIVVPYAPRKIFIYSGGNDVNAKKSPKQVAADFKKFVEKVRAKLPDVDIAYISIAGNPARWKQVEQVKEANGLIEAYCKATPKLTFIDVFTAMLGSDGLPKPDIFLPDCLHMNAEGYKIWTEVVGKHLGEPDKGS